MIECNVETPHFLILDWKHKLDDTIAYQSTALKTNQTQK